MGHSFTPKLILLESSLSLLDEEILVRDREDPHITILPDSNHQHDMNRLKYAM
jgi:hypothetical protein